ncbi:hypothetical protein SAMD00020551_4145 [Mesobacillus selenatarsenatis SF-1]|uniref:Uncharacterized protein n=1 Tax=Mesobacillus selenatarsenatis (strain DSM 18680 / JCM 14380 / FERM P-15431 / SF-1) TaxID=1321606 RepID=A0A0A8X9Q2_MESS1|nr:hypothetical protein SAMD00020551_4145 [Mesobacillus selenatarsenatis SF-1]
MTSYVEELEPLSKGVAVPFRGAFCFFPAFSSNNGKRHSTN